MHPWIGGALLLAAAQGVDDDALKARIEVLLRDLAAPEVERRQQAQKNLLDLPSRALPLLKKAAEASDEAEVRLRVANLGIPEPWTRAVPESLRLAGEAFRRIGSTHPSNREWPTRQMLRRIEELPLEEQRRLFADLDAQGDESSRWVALHGWLRFPPPRPQEFLPLLRDRDRGTPAAGILARWADDETIRIVMSQYVATAPDSRGILKQVLSRRGAPGFENLLGEREDVEILAATRTPRAEEVLLRLLAEGSPEARQGAAFVLGRRPSAAAREAVRAYRRENPKEDGLLAGEIDPDAAQAALKRPLAPRDEPWEIAAQGGPRLRAGVIDALRAAPTPPLLLLLGATGAREDAALLLPFLKDKALQEAAGEALDMIGDPENLKAIVEVFRRYEAGLSFGRAIVGPPVDGILDDLEAFLTRPEFSTFQRMPALAAVRLRPLPRFREILFRKLEDGSWQHGWSGVTADILLETVSEGDRAAVEKLKGSSSVSARAVGLLLDARLGRVDAPALAALASGFKTSLEIRSLLLQAAPDAPELRAAIAEAWKKNPRWKEGKLWLAGRGEAEAVETLKREIAARPNVAPEEQVLLALARGGDAWGWTELLETAPSRRLGPATTAALLAGETPKGRERLLLRARESPNGAALQVLATRPAPEAAALYLEVARHSLQESQREEVVVAALRALGKLKAREAVPELRSLVFAAAAAHRAAALHALGELGDAAAIPLIALRLDDPTPVPEPYDGTRWGPRVRVWDAAMDALAKISGVKAEGASTADRRAFWRRWAAARK